MITGMPQAVLPGWEGLVCWGIPTFAVLIISLCAAWIASKW